MITAPFHISKGTWQSIVDGCVVWMLYDEGTFKIKQLHLHANFDLMEDALPNTYCKFKLDKGTTY